MLNGYFGGGWIAPQALLTTVTTLEEEGQALLLTTTTSTLRVPASSTEGLTMNSRDLDLHAASMNEWWH